MQYFAMFNGQRVGPFSEEELQKRIEAGEVDGSTPVWHEGLEKWQPCSRVIEGVPEPEVWFAMVGGLRLGPLHRGALEQAVALGQVTADTKVWKPGMPKWRSWGKVAAAQGMKVKALDPTSLDGSLHPAAGASPAGRETFDFHMDGKRNPPERRDKTATQPKSVLGALFGRILPSRKDA